MCNKVCHAVRENALTVNCSLIFKPKRQCIVHLFISSPDPTKGQVSYCHHLASVVRRKRFQKSSPLKVLLYFKPESAQI
jgi:hypothetical protein